MLAALSAAVQQVGFVELDAVQHWPDAAQPFGLAWLAFARHVAVAVVASFAPKVILHLVV